MQIITDAIDFKPPRSGQWGTPVLLALVAHALLMAALTWGVHWQQDEPPVAFEAEIWSALPREAAPRAVEPPPPPPPPEPRPEPKPEPKPEPRPEPPPPQPAVKQPDIATEKAKQKKLEEEKRRELDEARKEKAAKDKAEREKKEKELAEKKKADDLKKKELAKKERERKEAEARQRQEATEKAIREDQMRRIMGQAGASGGAEARGSAQQSSGPSSGYAARVRARVAPNIRALEDFPRSLRTEIEVRALPDGTITSRRVVESSGNPAWDDAALKAIDRTGTLPRDVDGRVPSPIIIVVRPSD